MKKQLIIVFGFVFLIACSSEHQKQNLNIKQTDWKNDNLVGKVKALKQYKANVTDFQKGETEKPRIEFKKEYTNFGMISFQEYFDNFGKLKQETKNEYNGKYLRIKSVTKSYHPHSVMVQLNQYDTAGRPVSLNLMNNDTIALKTRLEYNNHGDLKKSLVIGNSKDDTIVFEYKYDKNGHILLKKQIQKDKSYENIITSEYDKNGNLVEETNKSDIFGEIKWTYKYDTINGFIENIEYQNGQVQQKTYFDKKHNQTLAKFYDNGKLNREMKFEYTFDKTGNWTVKKVFLKQNFAKNKKFKPVYVETRNLEYYE